MINIKFYIKTLVYNIFATLHLGKGQQACRPWRRLLRPVYLVEWTLLWHESEKKLFPKFQLIPILHLQVMHYCVHWHCFIDDCVKLIVVDIIYVKIYRIYVRIAPISHWNDFCLILLRKCASWRRGTNRCEIQILKFLRMPSVQNVGVCAFNKGKDWKSMCCLLYMLIIPVFKLTLNVFECTQY